MSRDLFYSLIPETMNDNLLIETKEIGDYRIKIYHDDYPSCPVQDWDMGAIHIFEHLEALIQDQPLRQHMAERMQAMVDGNGASRLVKIIQELVIR